MLYYLYEVFGINLFHYISVRAFVGFFIAFVVTLYLMPKFIQWARQKATQPIYELAPKTHQQKAQTPTMGGIVFLSAALFAMLISIRFNAYTLIGILGIILFMGLGLIDDRAKILGKSNHAGLTPKQKFIIQWIFAFLISTLIYISGFDTQLYIPFYKEPLFDMGMFAIVFWALVIVATSNSVNLTDGLDGLATVPSIFAFFSLAAILYLVGNTKFAAYLFLPHANVSELVILATSLIGALIGFLWYNAHPAEIFMGDSGSLTIGALIGILSIFAKSEFLLIFIGFIFLLESLSVILQVSSFKIRQKRIFKMAPIHHHFELVGWSENKIIVRFWIIAFITNLIAIISLKIR
ncbi:MAG: phospho-N-acetylmuramoyl-pentapeptide-transferase [Epsilonproteobacteria bacterium]|nr:phospho-N-acetylmuramoyl-pentapeptide-transferase [Campylobacterota bacterium]